MVFYLYINHRLLRTSPQSLVPTPGWVAGGIWTQSLPISLECLITLDHSLLTTKIAPWHWFKAQLLGSFSVLLSYLKCDFSFSFSWCSSYNLMIWYLVEQNLLPQYCIHVLLKIFSHAVRMQKNHFDLSFVLPTTVHCHVYNKLHLQVDTYLLPIMSAFKVQFLKVQLLILADNSSFRKFLLLNN